MGPILKELHIPMQVNQPLILGMTMQAHKNDLSVVGDHLSNLEPYMRNYNKAQSIEPSEQTAYSFDYKNGFILFSLLTGLALLVSLLSFAVHDLKPADSFSSILSPFLEEVIKSWEPSTGLLFIANEFEGVQSLPNVVIHSSAFFVDFNGALFLHFIYNGFITADVVLIFLGFLALFKSLVSKSKGNMTKSYSYRGFKTIAQPCGEYLEQVMLQKETLNETIYFTTPVVFPSAVNASFINQDKWCDLSSPYYDEFINPLTGQTNVYLEREDHRFSAHDKVVKERLEQDHFLSGYMLVGLAVANCLPRRQSETAQGYGSLIYHRLKKKHVLDEKVLDAAWDHFGKFYDSIKIPFTDEPFLLDYGVEWHNGKLRCVEDLSYISNRLAKLVSNFSGKKRKDYEKGAEDVFFKVFFHYGKFFAKAKGGKPFDVSYRTIIKELSRMELKMKLDELMVKFGIDLKPRPVFFHSIFIRALFGLHLISMKTAFYYTLPPYKSLSRGRRMKEYFENPKCKNYWDLLKRLNSKFVSLKTNPVQISIWVTYFIIAYSNSLDFFEWKKVVAAIADGKVYDLSADSKAVKKYTDFCHQRVGMHKQISENILLNHTGTTKISVTVLRIMMRIMEQFFTGHPITSSFNGMRNMAGMMYTYEKFLNREHYCLTTNGDDMFSLLFSKNMVVNNQLIKQVEIDQLAMCIESKAKLGNIFEVDYLSATFVPALREGNPILVLTYKMGKFCKSGSVYSLYSKLHPYEALYATSYMWMQVTKHHPLMQAWARMQNRIALKNLPKDFIQVKNPNSSYLDWDSEEVSDYYKSCQPYMFEEYMYARYKIDAYEISALKSFFDGNNSTVISNHPVLMKIVSTDLD
jgi:hypothetical protein